MTAALILTTGCVIGTSTIETPGTRAELVAPPATVGCPERWTFMARGPADSVGRIVGQGRTCLRPLPGDRLEFTQEVSAWNWSDTLVMDRRTLLPQSEVYRRGRTVVRLAFEGGVVHRWVDTGRGPEARPDHRFEVPVFAFAQRDLLLRALPLRSTVEYVLPLYSIPDSAVEFDTLALSRTATEGVWRLRFADPALVLSGDLTGPGRQIAWLEGRTRAGGGTMRMERDP